MDALELYKFITDNNCEYHWRDNDGEEDVILFIHFMNISDWQKLLGDRIMEEEGIDCVMKSGYFCFWMNDICEQFDIEMDKVFKKETA